MILAHTLDGHGPERVLMLHDWLGDSANYDAALPYFDPDFVTSARVDFPGYGGSVAHPLRGVGAATLDVDVLAVADHLGWAHFHLLAHSMSTVVAQRLARSAASRIASVTLVAPVTPGTHLPDPAVDFLRGIARDPSRRRDALASQRGDRLSARWLDVKLERWAACSKPEAVEAYVDLFARPNLAPTPAETSVPMLALTGADDAPPFAHAAVASALRTVHPQATVEVCPSAGHYPMQETPPLFASKVERFIRANRR